MQCASVPAKSIPTIALLEPAGASLTPKPHPTIAVVHFVHFKARELLDYTVQPLRKTLACIYCPAALPKLDHLQPCL